MNEAKLPADIIHLPTDFTVQNNEIRTRLEQFKQVNHPTELDAVTKSLGLPASLLNFYFATVVDLSEIGLGPAVHIPVQVSEREGGRKSIYYLDQNEAVLTGIYVTTSFGLALRFMTRVTGSTLPAQAGDIFATRITNREGTVVHEEQVKLEKFGPSAGGIGHFSSQSAAGAQSSVSFIGSHLHYVPDWWR